MPAQLRQAAGARGMTGGAVTRRYGTLPVATTAGIMGVRPPVMIGAGLAAGAAVLATLGAAALGL